MSGFAGSQPIILPKLGGLYTFLKPVDVPSGYSPNLQNVRFLPRAVFTRPGLTPRGGGTLGAAQFISNSSIKTTIFLDPSNFIFRNDSNGNPQFLSPFPIANTGSLLHVQQSFGREFMSYFTGPPIVSEPLAPGGPIRHWDGNFDAIPPIPTAPTVANSGAGSISAGTHKIAVIFEMAYGMLSVLGAQATLVAPGGQQALITNIPVGPVGCVARRLVMTTVADPNTFWFLPAFKINNNVTTVFTLNVSDGILVNGFPLSYIGSSGLAVPPSLPPLSPDGPGAAPLVGDSSAAGSVAIGVHQIQVIWETRWGGLTAPSPTAIYTASGGRKISVSNIPTGPWYVVARRILVTLSGGSDFFYITSNRIGDNTTTSIDLDFSDVILAAGSNFNYVARNFSPMDSYGVGVYNGRLTTWGGLNTLKGNNLGFDGGWDSTGPIVVPGGWNGGAFATGGVPEVLKTFCGEAWRITGDGVSAIRGQVLNGSIQSLLLPNTSYTVSFRASKAGNINSGAILKVELFSTTLGGSLGSVLVPVNTLNTNFTEFQGIILNGLGAIPFDCILVVSATNTLGVNESVIIDHIRLWPTKQKYESSVVRFSNPFDPETFDGVNGFIQVAKDNGEQVVACAQLRSFYYIFKERSMQTTYDDGTNPPSLWFTRSVDNTIGAGSPNGVTSSDTYLITMWRSGAYLYAGGRPTKVSQEIQTTWNKFLWQYAWTTHILLDTQGKQVMFFGPMGGSTQPQNSMVLDYSEGMGTEDDPAGRKWGFDQWPFTINGSLKFETATNQQALYFATASGLEEHTGLDDVGTPIDAFYETAFVKAGDHGQDTFLGCSYFAEGTGTLFVSMRGIDDVIVQNLAKNIFLVPAVGQQIEMYGNLESERCKIRFETTIDKTNFTLKGACVYAIPNMFEQRPQ